MGKITRLQLENLTCFEKLYLEFSNGVNVLIGVNGTGKTHILKVLYAACAITVGEGKDKDYMDKLRGVFSPYGGDLQRLCRHPLARNALTGPSITIARDNGHKLAYASLGNKGFNVWSWSTDDQLSWAEDALESAYIPVKEMLAHAPGFISLNAKREIAFEEVYVDIIMQAYLPKLKELPNTVYEKIFKDLTKAIGGEVILKGEHFFLKTEQGELEFSLLAEGLRKLSLVWLLIQNGSLNPGSILFWDEPEANLNPSLLGLVVETLLELQRQGVQIFLTTHNYVLLKEFDLRKKKDDAVRYISLFREKDADPVSAHSTEEYLAINPNAIAGTFDDLYDQEVKRSLTGA
ncbi:MAG: AAA family ATPase [Proteobacteria bacterium]|nr:AAA family ATPase [Pseudomonadota bacterium]